MSTPQTSPPGPSSDEASAQLTRAARRAEAAPAPDHDDLFAYAREWAEDDPDVATREEMQLVLQHAEDGDAEALADLRDRCAALLEFGTAGLRGALGAGPNRMNRAVVIRAAAGLVRHLQESTPHPVVVVGYDARLGSAQFAQDTAAVVVGAGGRALVLPTPLPTPVLAFAIRHLGADAGVMVTASHNPAQDNGYKVYLGDGSQIVPPVDTAIRRRIEAIRSVAEVPLAEEGWEVLGDDVREAYVAAVVALLPEQAPRDVRVVYTALHGVGGAVLDEAFTRAGFGVPTPVRQQHDPDPSFPTVAFPNPEEPGAIDLALALARRDDPDLVIANDPDADRCAVAIPDPAAASEADPRGWRMLRGDELGAILAWDVVQSGVAPGQVLARSIVSGRLIDAIAEHGGCRCIETLTGFKWIARVDGLRYGYEEAIGYCVAPQVVRDKDGISTALVVAGLAARLRAQGRTFRDILDQLALECGVFLTDAFSVRVDDLAVIGTVMARLREAAPTTRELAGVRVVAVTDLAAPTDGLPPTDGLRYLFEDGTRVIVRPSGTEPKLKVYLEAVAPAPSEASGLPEARAQAQARLDAARTAFEELTRA